MILRYFFLLLFLLAGIIAHDPWKQDEAYVFGIINHFLEYHSWLIPVNAGQPFLEKPPLYYWSAVLLCKLLSPPFSLVDAARLTSFCYMLMSCFCLYHTAEMIRKTSGFTALTLFLGTLGVVRHSHDMFNDVALVAGSCLALYAMMLFLTEQERWKKSGLLLGLGLGIAFLSKGFLVPLIYCMSGFILVMLRPELRQKNTLYLIGFALLAASPFLFIWETALYLESPALFKVWLIDNNIGRFLGFSVAKLGADNKPFYMLYTPFWFAFPVFPLALYYSVRSVKSFPAILLFPLLLSITGVFLLNMAASARALYLLPLIPAFTLLAVPALEDLPQKYGMVANRLMKPVFMTIASGFWLLWLNLRFAPFLPAFMMKLIGTQLPLDFVVTSWQLPEIIVSAFALFYVYKSKKDLWFVGIACLWITYSTLLMPWLDVTKSYRPLIADMNDFIAHSPYKDDCLNNIRLGETIAPMLEYFDTRHAFRPIEVVENASCNLLVMSTMRNERIDFSPHWKLVWRGSRLLDAKDEEMRLFLFSPQEHPMYNQGWH